MRTIGILLGLTALGALWVPSAAWADDEKMGFFEVRRKGREAEDALEAGRVARALELYNRLIAGTEPDSRRHADALFGAVVSDLARAPEERDLETSRRRLASFLERFPSHDRQAEARALASLLSEMETARRQAETSSRRLEESLGRLEQVTGAEGRGLEQAVSELERHLARLRAELKAVKAELAKKDEALEELRKVALEGNG